MSDDTATSLSVSVKELPSVHVAYIACLLKGEPGEFGEIHECFQRVQAWVRERGYDPFSQLNVGALRSMDGRPSSYDCCVQVPEVQSGSGDVEIQELPGGRYEVVSIRKDPAIIGDSIHRFYQFALRAPRTRSRLTARIPPTRFTTNARWSTVCQSCSSLIVTSPVQFSALLG